MLLTKGELQRASAICGAAGAWLVVDNTYEHFTYEGESHHCVNGPHVINLFSFSKARCGRVVRAHRLRSCERVPWKASARWRARRNDLFRCAHSVRHHEYCKAALHVERFGLS